MALMTQRHQVGLVVRATVPPWRDMVHIGGHGHQATVLTLRTQRMVSQERQAQGTPASIVTTLSSRTALGIVVSVALPLERAAPGAHAVVYDPRAARLAACCAGSLGHHATVWHIHQ